MSDARCRTACGRFRRLEFVTAMAILGFALLLALGVLPRTRAARELRACQENMKTIGVALRMYASESTGERYPLPKLRDCAGEVQPWSGALDLEGFYPEYLKNLDLLVCPAYPAGETAREVWDEGKTTNPRWTAVEGFSHNGEVEPCEVLAKPYYYYGWALSEATFEAVTQNRPLEPEDFKREFAKGGGVPFTAEFYGPVHYPRFRMAVKTLEKKLGSGEVDGASATWHMEYANGKPVELPIGSELWLLREGIERFYLRDIGNPVGSTREKSRIVVLHEELFVQQESFYHSGARMNVLYMDGHVAGQVWSPGGTQKFPLNEAGSILRDAVEGTLTYEPRE